MNIFFLHLLPRLCAQMHCNAHVVKMILETCQLLCSAHWMSESSYAPPYRLTHKNHPCAKWVRASLGNYNWLCQLGLELCAEYTFRYGKEHKCQAILADLQHKVPNLPDNGFTRPAQAMPDRYKALFDENTTENDTDQIIDAYRQYYFFEKSHLLMWKIREEPTWIAEIRDLF